MSQKKKFQFIIIFIFLIIIVTGCDQTDSDVAPETSQISANRDSDRKNPFLSPPKRAPSIVSQIDGAPMVPVPAGEFIMGSSDAQVEKMAKLNPKMRELMKHEQPQHSVFLSSFYIDQYEVTNAQFLKFVETTGYVTDAEKEGWGFVWEGGADWPQVQGANWRAPLGPESSIEGKLDHPVVQVSYNDALAYSRWADKRLPTEAEWEKASRGTDARIYPWGNRWNPNNLNGFDKGPHTTTPVGSYPDGVSPYGAYDMVGNVWEWVYDWYHHAYYQWSPYRNPKGPSTGTHRVLRGGCWLNIRYSTRCAHRDNYVTTPNFRVHLGGFRCALDAEDAAAKKALSKSTWGEIKKDF